MKKMKNRFIAWLIVFTSIIAFLPVDFGGLVANAATTSDATTIRVNMDKETYMPVTVSKNELIFSHPEALNTDSPIFNMTVKDIRTTTEDLEKAAKGDGSKPGASTGVINQQVVLKKINRVAVPDTTGTLADMGVSYTPIEGNDSVNKEQVIGQRIQGLAFGINKIEYQVIVTTQIVTYTPKYDADGKVILGVEGDYTYKQSDSNNISNDSLTIEYGTKFAISKIKELKFNSYVGQRSDFDNNDNVLIDKNNEAPFLYTETAEPDSELPLKYNFNVPDSTNMLKYFVTFDNVSIQDAKIYLNGQKDSSLQVNGNEQLVGSLQNFGDSLIVIRVQGDEGSDLPLMTRTYAMEINYDVLDFDKDFSLSNAGITKQYMNDDTSVLAYIGKKFMVEKDLTGGFPIFNGDITVDSRAKQISINPALIAGSGKSGTPLAYSVMNYYSDDGNAANTKYIKASLSGGDGKKYIDFQKGAFSNQLQVDVYKGDGNGNIADSSNILARYVLNVHVLNDQQSTMNLSFNSSPEAYLRQPGVKDSILDFTPSRVTYDLCFGDPSVDQVADPVTITYTGQQSNKNEYIKIFSSDSVDGNNFTEMPESKANNYDANTMLRSKSIDVSLGKAQKIYVQAYYDKFDQKQVTNSDGTTQMQNVLVGSYPAGDRYVFYLPNNYNKSNQPTPGETSSNALLNFLKVNGYTIKDSNDNGFSSDVTDYTVTVNKTDKTEKITAIAQDDNVKSISATVSGSGETYDLVSGQESEIPLSSSGSTNVVILVTAQDGTTTKTYNILIKNNTKGTDTNLKNVILSTGDYTFDPSQIVTKVRVDQNVSNIKVTPVPEDSKAKVTVKGDDYLGTPINVSLKGEQETDIEIEVVSEDGTQSKVYTLEIFRVDAGDWDNNSGNGGDQYDDDQFYDDYNNCWVDLTKYEEWGSVNGKPAYFDKHNRQVKNAWISTGGKYYYLNNLGYRAAGWKIDDTTKQTYYLDPTTGEMRKGWMNLNGSWYYLGLNGIMKTGWLYSNGKWYYFTPNGQMITNQSMYIDDKTYNFGQDGAARL